MRMTTEVWAKFESKGKPDFDKTINGPVQSVVMQFAQWIQVVYMGSHIRVTFARSESELIAATSRGKMAGGDMDMMAELEAMMNQDQLPLPDGEPELRLAGGNESD